jgi:hypothetical protein
MGLMRNSRCMETARSELHLCGWAGPSEFLFEQLCCLRSDPIEPLDPTYLRPELIEGRDTRPIKRSPSNKGQTQASDWPFAHVIKASEHRLLSNGGEVQAASPVP